MAETPPTIISYQHGASKVAAVDQQLMARDELLTDIRARLIQSQVTMKEYQDQKRREVLFQEGDWVWLKLQQRTAVGVTPATHSKLGPSIMVCIKFCRRLVRLPTSFSCQAVPGSMMYSMSRS
jgi:hypothetical protein